jgi:hypothetical protein
VVPPNTEIVPAETLRFNTVGWPTVAETDATVLLASRTVTVYVPAGRLVADAVVCTGVVFQLYVNGALPPVTETSTEPLDAPLQVTSFQVLTDTETGVGAGSVKVIVLVLVQPLASVTV